ncbi:MAG: helix-turn-helix domain-containing protein [Elusimicrobia bacterium]|nr:helix-turn-helix domain-containing protein [Elusimicrobiota bacterium]
MDKLYADIGGRMRALRKALRRTQAEVAEAAGIDASFYGQVERGKNVPSLKTVLAVAAALGVEPGELLPGGAPAGKGAYSKAIEKLLVDLGPGERRLVLGMVSDMADRLRR